MNINTVRYGRTFNLGNYESEKIELEAELEEGEVWLDVLEDLKGKVTDRPEPEINGYPLYTSGNKLVEVYSTASEWCKVYAEAIYKSNDAKSFIEYNSSALDKIDLTATHPKALEVVNNIRDINDAISKR